MGDWGGKLDTGINQWKTFRTQWESVGGKPKDHRYCRWKNLPTWTKNREKKTEVYDEKGDFVEIRCCSGSESNCQWLNYQMQAPWYSVRKTDLWFTRRLLALENQTDSDTFFVASIDALCSTFVCWLSSLLFGGELDCWSSHQYCGVDGKKSRWRLVRIVFVEQTDELSQVLDCWGWLLGIFFLWIPFSRHQVVKTW